MGDKKRKLIDPEQLSTSPAQIRTRLRRNARQHNPAATERDIKLYAKIKWGKPIEEWDLQELAKGRPRNPDGNFYGPAPKWITPAIAKEAKKRLMDETLGDLAGHVDQAVKAIAKLLINEDVDDKGRPIVDARTRLSAAQFVIENVLGKPKTLVEIEASNSVREILAGAIVLDDGMPQGHLAIEGEIVEEGDDD